MSEIAESFGSSLSELTVNSKPHINMLTMLAEDHLEFAPVITQTVLSHLQKVRPEVKLPCLYLIDSIVKNVGKAYINLFTQAIVQHFTNTFEEVDEKTREQMFKLRQTWGDVFPAKTLFALDKKVHQVDPAWPVPPPPSTVHLNPKFFKADILATSPTSSASTDSAPTPKPTPTPENLREQVILKQKMLLELQQQKLKLELLHTQAQLEEQQKQLEKTPANHKASSELSKLQQIVKQEETKLKLMNKNLKKQVQMNYPKLQHIHRATSDMKAQKMTDMSRLTTPVGPESLLKPAAFLELDKDDLNIKPVKPATLPKEPKSKIIQLQQSVEKQKSVNLPDSSEEPSPVRIAPPSSQLINAALSFGRNVRDPRIRQMSSRLESQQSSAVTTKPINPVPTQHHPPLVPLVPDKKPESTHSTKSHVKPRRDKKMVSHQQKERLKHSEEDNSKNNLRSSNRSNDRVPSKSGKVEKSPPSKKSEERSDKKSKGEDLFNSWRLPTQSKNIPNTNSTSKSYSKRDQSNLPVTELVSKTHPLEKISKPELSPRRNKSQGNWLAAGNGDNGNDVGSVKPVQTLSLDVTKGQSIKLSDEPKPKTSPDPMNNSAEMLYEDVEKIVKNPGIVLKTIQPTEVVQSKDEESEESLKSSDDSIDQKFDDIIKHPSKQVRFEKKNRIGEEKLQKTKSVSFETPNDKIDQLVVKMAHTSDQLPEPLPNITTSDSTYKQLNITEENNEEVLTSTKQITSEPFGCQQTMDQSTTNKVSSTEEAYGHQNEGKINKDQKELAEEQTMIPEFEFTNMQHDISDGYLEEEVVSTEIIGDQFEEYVPFSKEEDAQCVSSSKKQTDESVIASQQDSDPPICEPDLAGTVNLLPIPKASEILTLSPKKIVGSTNLVEPMDTIVEYNEDIPGVIQDSPKKSDKRRDSPVHEDKKFRKGEKPSIMEQIIADAEKHEASPSPPPPPVISDKFKEIKQSSLSRLRRVGRLRDDLADAESPEPADVDLRPQIQPPSLRNDLKNEVLGLADKDVDLRNLPASPTKKRPSMEKLLDAPPAKKSKAEVLDELFGSEDVDLRPVLCPPPPSPPPPPIISSSPPPDNAGEKLWARYKQAKPDTYKAKYTPPRRDRPPSVDKFRRNARLSSSEVAGTWQERNRMYQEDIDMRAQPQAGTEGSYNNVIIQALEQYKRGDLEYDAYHRVLSEVFALREQQQLKEAKRRLEAEAQSEQLEPIISDDDISGGSLSGVEDAPSPTESYSGGEEVDDNALRKSTADKQKPINDDQEMKASVSENLGDVDIRMLPVDVDIRLKMDYQSRVDHDKKSDEKLRGVSPYSRKSSAMEKERYRVRREELKAQRKEKRAKREQERGSRYRKSRFHQEPWDSEEGRSITPGDSMDVDAPRVPPIPHYEDDRNYREPPVTIPPRDFLPKQQDSPPMHQTPWEPQRMPTPSPWMPGMAPASLNRGPPVMGMRLPQDRFMHPRWRQPGPGGSMFEGEPGSRFNRFGPMQMGRFPVPIVPCEVPPTDPAVLQLIEEDPTKSINIDGVPRDIRFYGMTAVAFMSWDDPREVCFQPGQRRVIVDDRESMVVHFNAPPVEIIIDGKPHRLRFGAPTRELYIDNQWFEVLFGGAPVTVDIAGKPHTLQLEGPPPPVRPGNQRKDLVVGKTTLIIDAECIFTVYLDAKPQKFEVKGVSYIIRFVEALQKTVINGVAFKSDFGGLPRPIILNGSKHFFRLNALPRGVTPGFLTIVNMEGGRLPSPPSLPAPPQLPATLEHAVECRTEPKTDQYLQPPVGVIPGPPMVSPEMLKTAEVETPALQPPPTMIIPPQTNQLPLVNPLDILTTLMPVPEPRKSSDYSYSVDNENSNQATSFTAGTVSNPISSLPSLTGEINVTELLQKLMATGIVPTQEQPKEKGQDKLVTTNSCLIKPVDFRKPETLKVRQSAIITHLYSGIQCNSCGVRFPPEQTMKYSQHLDWHFRQNRRDKDSSRTAQTRRYYYDVNDWVQFEEIEDLEERAQPWFEIQEGGAEEEPPPQVLVSVLAADYPEDAVCQICHDKFESFYNEEKEEWHLRNAVDHDGKLVHPLCLEDEKAAAEKPIIVEDIDITGDESKEEVEEKKEEEPAKVEEDDDIMEVMDIEFVKPVFPVEDLTVSDSESVADNNEEKPELEDPKEELEIETEEKVEEPSVVENTNNEISDGVKDEEETETKTSEPDKIEEESKEDSQDVLMLLDQHVDRLDQQGEDSVLSTTEIMEVVRNIKKDPDALGGEFEETGEIKKEKGEVPLPAPVVDTTHTSVTCLIDGNVEFDETPQQINVGGPPKIKINITKSNVQSISKDPKENEPEPDTPDTEGPNSTLPATLALVTQPPPPGEEPVPLYIKPKLIGKKLQELPPVLKGSELSGLCSIM